MLSIFFSETHINFSKKKNNCQEEEEEAYIDIRCAILPRSVSEINCSLLAVASFIPSAAENHHRAAHPHSGHLTASSSVSERGAAPIIIVQKWSNARIFFYFKRPKCKQFCSASVDANNQKSEKQSHYDAIRCTIRVITDDRWRRIDVHLHRNRKGKKHHTGLTRKTRSSATHIVEQDWG